MGNLTKELINAFNLNNYACDKIGTNFTVEGKKIVGLFASGTNIREYLQRIKKEIIERHYLSGTEVAGKYYDLNYFPFVLGANAGKEDLGNGIVKVKLADSTDEVIRNLKVHFANEFERAVESKVVACLKETVGITKEGAREWIKGTVQTGAIGSPYLYCIAFSDEYLKREGYDSETFGLFKGLYIREFDSRLENCGLKRLDFYECKDDILYIKNIGDKVVKSVAEYVKGRVALDFRTPGSVESKVQNLKNVLSELIYGSTGKCIDGYDYDVFTDKKKIQNSNNFVLIPLVREDSQLQSLSFDDAKNIDRIFNKGILNGFNCINNNLMSDIRGKTANPQFANCRGPVYAFSNKHIARLLPMIMESPIVYNRISNCFEFATDLGIFKGRNSSRPFSTVTSPTHTNSACSSQPSSLNSPTHPKPPRTPPEQTGARFFESQGDSGYDSNSLPKKDPGAPSPTGPSSRAQSPKVSQGFHMPSWEKQVEECSRQESEQKQAIVAPGTSGDEQGACPEKQSGFWRTAWSRLSGEKSKESSPVHSPDGNTPRLPSFFTPPQQFVGAGGSGSSKPEYHKNPFRDSGVGLSPKPSVHFLPGAASAGTSFLPQQTNLWSSHIPVLPSFLTSLPQFAGAGGSGPSVTGQSEYHKNPSPSFPGIQWSLSSGVQPKQSAGADENVPAGTSFLPQQTNLWSFSGMPQLHGSSQQEPPLWSIPLPPKREINEEEEKLVKALLDMFNFYNYSHDLVPTNFTVKGEKIVSSLCNSIDREKYLRKLGDSIIEDCCGIEAQVYNSSQFPFAFLHDLDYKENQGGEIDVADISDAAFNLKIYFIQKLKKDVEEEVIEELVRRMGITDEEADECRGSVHLQETNDPNSYLCDISFSDEHFQDQPELFEKFKSIYVEKFRSKCGLDDRSADRNIVHIQDAINIEAVKNMEKRMRSETGVRYFSRAEAERIIDILIASDENGYYLDLSLSNYERTRWSEKRTVKRKSPEPEEHQDSPDHRGSPKKSPRRDDSDYFSCSTTDAENMPEAKGRTSDYYSLLEPEPESMDYGHSSISGQGSPGGESPKLSSGVPTQVKNVNVSFAQLGINH